MYEKKIELVSRGQQCEQFIDTFWDIWHDLWKNEAVEIAIQEHSFHGGGEDVLSFVVSLCSFIFRLHKVTFIKLQPSLVSLWARFVFSLPNSACAFNVCRVIHFDFAGVVQTVYFMSVSTNTDTIIILILYVPMKFKRNAMRVSDARNFIVGLAAKSRVSCLFWFSYCRY